MSIFFFFKQKTAYEMRISDWSSDVCSSELKHSEIGGGWHTPSQYRESIANMDHSDYGIEAPPVDRNATMPGLSEQGHQFVKAGAFLYGDDVRAGNGNVVHCMFAKMEEIFEHLALNRRQKIGRAHV